MIICLYCFPYVYILFSGFPYIFKVKVQFLREASVFPSSQLKDTHKKNPLRILYNRNNVLSRIILS